MTLWESLVNYVYQFNEMVVQPRISELWTRIEPHYETAKKVLFALIIAFNISCISLSISAFIFGTIYFYNLPTVYHTFPLHFQYDRLCMQQHKLFEVSSNERMHQTYTKHCFPVSKIHLGSPKDPTLLQEAQLYGVVVKLELPETPANLNMGMFMVKMDVTGHGMRGERPPYHRKSKWTDYNQYVENSPEVSYTSSRSISMQYKSSLIRYMYKLIFWPLLLMEFQHESQKLDVILFDDLLLKQGNLNWTASVYIEHPSIDVYSASLDVIAKFTGLQYILYRWPIVSFLLGTAVFFLPVLFTVILMFYFCIWRPLCGARTPTPERNYYRERGRHSRRPCATTAPAVDDQTGNIAEESYNPMQSAANNPEAVEDLAVNRSANEAGQISHYSTEVFESSSHSRSSSSSSIEMIAQPAADFPSDSNSSYLIPNIFPTENSRHSENDQPQKGEEFIEPDTIIRQRNV